MSVHQSEDYGIPKEIVVVGMVGEAGVVTEEEEDMEVSNVRSRKKIHWWGRTRSRPELRHQ